MTPHKFTALDGLRGVAAVAVVQRHTTPLFWGEYLYSSYLAVDLFFMLSGFVLAHAYECRLLEGMGWRGFMAARYRRLYPMYLISLALALSFAVIDHFFNPNAPLSALAVWAVAGLLFLPVPPNFASADGNLFPLNGPAWSLFFELVINAVYAAIVRLLTGRVLVGIIVVSFLALIAASVLVGAVGAETNRFVVVTGLPRVSFSFFLGVLLYRHQLSWPWLRHAAWPCMLLLAASFTVKAPGAVGALYPLAVIALLNPVLILAAAASRPRPWSLAVFGFLGAASYAIYVLHVPAYQWLTAAWPKMTGADISSLAPYVGFGFIAVMLLVSWALDRRRAKRPVNAAP